jgi:glycosyltransferase involved in cell wall biosynthesis
VLLEADVVIPVSHDMQRLLLEKSPRLTREKFSMLPNGYDDVDFENWVKSPSDIFTITYAGTLTQQYKMGTFLRVLDTMAKALPIRLVLAGKYDEVVANQLKSLTHVEVVDQGYITHKAVIELLGKTDALLLALPDLPGYTGILPGKLFEYLATQQPILCLGTTSSDAAKIIAQAKAGETCTYDDESALNKTLLAWVKRWQQNEKPVVNTGFIKQFSRKALTQQLSALILQ